MFFEIFHFSIIYLVNQNLKLILTKWNCIKLLILREETWDIAIHYLRMLLLCALFSLLIKYS